MPIEQSLDLIQPVVVSRLARASARRRSEVQRDGATLTLTPQGRDIARSLVRSHRLWESYLVDVLGLRPDHVHDTAMRLEHVVDEASGARLTPRVDRAIDPHDRPIPQAITTTDSANDSANAGSTPSEQQ